jgi:hypothetical protein
MAHPFFLSYARNDERQRADPHMTRFVEELNWRVGNLTGAKEDGFRDITEIKPGQEWREELVDALCAAPTMVCLYSPAYFLSEACGKELQVFLERRRKYVKENAGKKPASIIPILWHPCLKISRAVPDFEYQRPPGFDPRNYGIWDLSDQGKDNEFRQVINNVALRIRDATEETPLPELDLRPIFGGVQNAFEPLLPLRDFDATGAVAGPDCVTFVYSSDPAWDSWPYAPPVQRALLHISASVATGRDYFPHQLTYDVMQPNLISRLQQASERNNLVVTFVDGRSLKQESVQQRLREYDEQHFETFSTMLIWPKGSDLDQGSVQRTFPSLSLRRPPFFYSNIGTPEQLDQAVSNTLDALKMAVLRQPQNPRPLPQSSEFTSLPTTGGIGHSGN